MWHILSPLTCGIFSIWINCLHLYQSAVLGFWSRWNQTSPQEMVLFAYCTLSKVPCLKYVMINPLEAILSRQFFEGDLCGFFVEVTSIFHLEKKTKTEKQHRLHAAVKSCIRGVFLPFKGTKIKGEGDESTATWWAALCAAGSLTSMRTAAVLWHSGGVKALTAAAFEMWPDDREKMFCH